MLLSERVNGGQSQQMKILRCARQADHIILAAIIGAREHLAIINPLRFFSHFRVPRTYLRKDRFLQ